MTAAGAVSAGFAQVLVAQNQFQRSVWYGVGFALLTVAWLALGPFLAVLDTRAVWRCAVVVSLISLCVESLGDMDLRHQPLALVQFGAAALVLLTSIATLLRSTARHRVSTVTSPSRWTAAAGAGVLALGLVGTGSAMVAQASSKSPTDSPTPSASASASPTHSMAGMSMAMAAAGNDQYWDDVSGQAFKGTGVTRTYFISADQVVWDYAPLGFNAITGQPFDDTANIYVKTGPGRIGSKYEKCIYRGYTDSSFATLKARAPEDAYLGFLGPVIQAEVGDTIKVVFRNTCPFATSVHPHGVFYNKNSEGAPYNDGTTGADKADDAVPTGGRHTYIWQVPARTGPGPGDGSSVMWMYHSHTDEVHDTYAGLMGFMVVTAHGMANPDGSPKDVDRQVFENFMVGDENNSPFIQANVDRFAQAPAPALDDEDFVESNKMHNINGYVFGNQPLLTLHKGERVRWYVMAMGTEFDVHTPHWHGNVLVINGMRTDVTSLLPAQMVVGDMVPDNPGIWLLHCHVGDHITAGMMTRYQVLNI
ncbi:MAG TPA: multicopper oxidase domain-containing protein [Streptosporangiaceae bacterium]|nr:multicopper oxidase domain-containing protein [Streptosporangiaceae bacterium]